MPVHADLLSSLTPPQAPKTLQQIYDDQDKLAQAQAKRDAVIQQAKDDAAVRAAFGAHSTPDGGVDFDGLLSDLGGKISPSAYTALQKTIDDHREKASQTVERELKNRKTKLDISLGLTDFATDPDSWGVVRPALIAADPDLASVLPEPWSDQIPALLQKAKGLGLTEKERQDQQFNTWKELQTLQRGTPEYLTKARTFLGQALSSEAPDHLDSAIDAFVAAWIPKVVADQFRGKTPEQAAQMAITPEKQAELDAQKATQDRIAQNESVNQGLRAREVAVQEKRLQADQTTGWASGANTGGDAEAIADAIAKGDQPPSLTGLYRFAGPVRAALARKGYDLTRATEDWTATNKYLNTLNGAQQVRLRQAVTFANDSLGILEGLTKEWDAGQFPLLNKATIATAKQGALGQKAQSLATRLEAQIADLTSELGTVYKGGNSSTDESLRLAAENLNANWSKQTLLDAIGLVRKNLTIRTNSIKNTGVVAGRDENPYAPSNTSGAGDVPADVAALLKDKPSMIYHLNVGDFQKNPDGTITRIRK